MSQRPNERLYVGDVRPSQVMYTYGVGSIVDLPNLSVIVMGLDDWKETPPLVEERLLYAVRHHLPLVQTLRTLPKEEKEPVSPFERAALEGIPVAVFPRWWVCPACRILAPLRSGLFELDKHPYHPDRTVYRHKNCTVARKPPEVIPARILVACEFGHLDDFPWVEFVHRGETCRYEKPLLKLVEYGATGEARDLEVKCECGASRRLAEAFGQENRARMPVCNGRRPHLRDYDPDGCQKHVRPIVLGATNLWFPINISALSIPAATETLARLVEEDWHTLSNVVSIDYIAAYRAIGRIRGGLEVFADQEIFESIQKHRQGLTGIQDSGASDIRLPEWQVLSKADPALNGAEYRTRRLALSDDLRALHLADVVLVERLREVQAMIGFARLDAVGELTDPTQQTLVQMAPLSRTPPTWVPASELRGEGLFLRFEESVVATWENLPDLAELRESFMAAHINWRKRRGIQNPADGFPGMRYVLLHSFSHALMRQISLEAGYSAASLKERIYARSATALGGPMMGVLVYTAATDSEGTLGGLIGLGEDERALHRLIAHSLEMMRLCAGDPICAEREVDGGGRTVHGAACHGCLFAPETSCERGNRYLDRRVLVPTMQDSYHGMVFFRR